MRILAKWMGLWSLTGLLCAGTLQPNLLSRTGGDAGPAIVRLPECQLDGLMPRAFVVSPVPVEYTPQLGSAVARYRPAGLPAESFAAPESSVPEPPNWVYLVVGMILFLGGAHRTYRQRIYRD